MGFPSQVWNESKRCRLSMVCLAIAICVYACDDGASGPVDLTNAITDIEVGIHDKVETILVVTWTQDEDFDELWIRYTFEKDEWMKTPTVSRSAGDHEQVLLGIPERTDVTIQFVAKLDGEELESEPVDGTTGSVPLGMPRPNVELYDSARASPNRWLLGSVESTPSQNEYYSGPFWVYIIDREGRIVWYYSDLGDNPILAFPRVSRDGGYIFFANRTPFYSGYKGFVPVVTKITLDWEYFDELEMPLSDNVDMTDDGSFLFNTGSGGQYKDSRLVEYSPDGSMHDIWNCSSVFGADCYSNTINWNPADDSVLLSFPYLNTVVQIDRKSGDIIGQYGDAKGSYSFDSDLWGFGFQHYANITPEGTLMVSSHIPSVDGKHAFMEFEIDREAEKLVERWIYREGNEWAEFMGEAHRVENGNGNVLANYGTGGVIKEIAPNKTTVWYVKWNALFPDDRYNKMVGHSILIDDLYALCEGPLKE